MQHFSLEPSKRLLNSSFGGYKLSLDSVPVHEAALPAEVDRLSPNDDQYSFLHMRLFSLHNHLYQDQWNNKYVYLFNKNKEIVCSVFNELTGHLTSTAKVFQFTENIPSNNFVNLSLSFVSQDLVLVSNGCKSMYLLSTGSRESSSQSWNILLEEEVISEETGFVILDSKFCSTKRTITCMLLSVVDAKSMNLKTASSNEDASKFVSFLNIITLVEDNQKWLLKGKKQLYCSGEVEYASLENDSNHLCVISKEPFTFFFDSESPIVEDKPEEDAKQNGENKIEYYWQQTSENLTLWFNVPSDTSNSQISVEVRALELNIRCDDRSLLHGVLHSSVVDNLTTWALDRNKLEVCLSKQESGLMWPSAIKNDASGEEIIDAALVQEIHERLAYLCSEKEVKAKDVGDMCAPTFNIEQLEECDAVSCDSRIFSRLDLTAHTSTHQACLSGVQWLFNCSISPDQGEGFCLRHDVDGCVWVPRTDASGNWRCEHIATFLALGYVQASKTQKKFIVCPPDFSYAAICEATRHVYLYKQSCTLDSELRNRKSGSKVGKIAKQQLINLPSNEEVLGIQATNQSIFVLTTAHLYCLDIV